MPERDRDRSERILPGQFDAEPPRPQEALERNRVILITLAAAILAFGLGIILPYFGYVLSWAPHRLFKTLAVGCALAVVLARPTWMPYLLCLAFPFAAWLPKSPIPMLNTANLLTIGSLLGIIQLFLRRKIDLVTPTTMNVPIALFLGWMILSGLFGAYLNPAGEGLAIHELRTLWGIASGFLAFYVTTHLVLDRQAVWRTVGFLLVGSTLGLLGPLREALERGFGARTGGGIGDINRMGAYLAIASVFAFSMIPAYRKIRKVGTALSSLLLAVGLILPNSRGAYAGFLFASLPQALRTSISGTILLVALLASSIVWAPGFVKDRVFQTYEAASSSDRTTALDEDSGGRLTVWGAILDVVAHHPVAGVGFGNLQAATHVSLGRYKAGHNLFLEVAGEMGLIGLFLLLWIFVRGWRLGTRLTRRGGRPAVLGRAYHGVILSTIIVNLFGQRLLDFSLAGHLFTLTGLVALEERLTRPEAAKEIP